MAEPRIEIVIAAQAQQFKQELDAVQARLEKLEGAVTGTGQKIRKNFTKNTNQAQNALRDFSRVVQDAPFGIIGVGNNIQELAGSFGFLVRSSGGVRAALSGVIGALSGPGGLILAVSAITTALTVFERRNQGAKKEVDKLKDSIKELVSANDDQERILKAQLGVQTKQSVRYKEILKDLIALRIQDLERLKVLRRTINDTDELKTLTTETISSLTVVGQILSSVYDGVGTIIKDKLSGALDEILEASSDYAIFVAETVQKLLEQQGIYVTINKEAVVQAENQERINQKKKNTEAIDAEIAEINEEIFNLLKKQNEEAGKRTFLTPSVPVPEGLDDVFGINDDALKDLNTGSLKYQKYINRLAQSQRDANRQIKDEDENPWITLRNQALEGLQDLGIDTIAGGITDLFGSVASAIADGGNVFQAAGASLLKTFSKFLTAYGTQLITYGKLTVAKGKLDIAAAVGGPFAVAAGLAAIKVGIAAAAAGAALGALANSGLFGAGGAGGVSATGGGSTSVQAPSFAPSEQVVVFEIAGDKLIGVLDNTYSRNNRLSGSTVRR